MPCNWQYKELLLLVVWLYGIDTSAHQGAIEVGGKTIAVLGSGFDYIFPEENKSLYKKILQHDGLVMTEYSPDTKPKSTNFLERNRIISGLSIGVLVIESAYRSGTSVTARIAKKQGKLVFALPHEIDNRLGIGTNRLIQNGAILVTKVEDMIQQYPFLKYDKKKEVKILQTKVVKKQPDERYREIFNFISEKPLSLNEIYQKSTKSVGEINHILLMLELDGYIRKTAEGYQCI